LAAGVSFALVACGNKDPHLIDGGVDETPPIDAAVPDTTPPETVIDSQPPALGNVAAAHFAFHSSEVPATFECIVDNQPPKPCDATFDVTVNDGPHTFSVVARDLAGNVDPTPATAAWTVDTAPPDTTITKHPPKIDNSTTVAMEFTSEAGARFECRLDGGAFADCTSPDTLKDLQAGLRTFEVRAVVAAAGNADPSPDSWQWTIDTTKPDTIIDSGPSGAVQATTAKFTFHSSEPGAGDTFTCTRDGASAPCTSGVGYDNLDEGPHTFTV